jgi:hypothetical protein
MFEDAIRQKIRFDSPKGLLTAEDLWDLPLQSTVSGKANLDDIARALHKQLKNGDDVSFVSTATKSDPTVQLKFDIVKYVIEQKMKENAVASERQDSDLKAMPMAELQKLLENL